MSEQRFLGYGRHLVDDADIAAVVEVLRSDFLTQGPVIARFEDAVAERVGAEHAIAVSSGTAALHLACLAAGLGPGDVGITSPLTFVGSANSMLYAGATPVLVDIDRQHLGITEAGVANALRATPDARVVMPVHFAGLPAESAGIRAAAGARIVVEDAAQSLGADYDDGLAVGSCAHSDLTLFSTHPVKSITTGEGGILTTNDADVAARLRRLRNHGIEREPERWVEAAGFEDGQPLPWWYEQQELGFNYRLTDIQAALGLSQLTKLDRALARRREVAGAYDAAFAGLTDIELPQSQPAQRQRSALHLYTVRFDVEQLGRSRRCIIESLRAQGVGSQVHFIPVYRHPLHHERGEPAAFPETERYYAGCLSLPLHPGLTDDEVERVIGAVRGAVA